MWGNWNRVGRGSVNDEDFNDSQEYGCLSSAEDSKASVQMNCWLSGADSLVTGDNNFVFILWQQTFAKFLRASVFLELAVREHGNINEPRLPLHSPSAQGTPNASSTSNPSSP